MPAIYSHSDEAIIRGREDETPFPNFKGTSYVCCCGTDPLGRINVERRLISIQDPKNAKGRKPPAPTPGLFNSPTALLAPEIPSPQTLDEYIPRASVTFKIADQHCHIGRDAKAAK